MKLRYIVTFLIIFTSLISTAQIKKSELYKKKISAKDHYDNHEFNYALDLYLELEQYLPNDPEVLYHIGICYINMEDAKSIPYFEKCLERKNEFPPELSYFLATAYHIDNQFNKALQFYESYVDYLLGHKKHKKDYETLREINREIDMCKNGIELVNDSLNIEITNLGPNINSIYPDYGAIVTADDQTLIFTSERPNTVGSHKDKIDGYFHEDIYISYKDSNGEWSKPTNDLPTLNTEGNDASISLSPDGQVLFIYRYHHVNMITSSGDLYMSKLIGDTWSEPELLTEKINQPNSWEPSVSISADGNEVFFSSNKKDGYGGTDIYRIKKLHNGEWAEPENLGSHINTPYDEDVPYLHPDGKTLYFCSNGHKSMGGYDIFTSTYDKMERKWSTPKNIGYPINSAHDDLYFSITADGKKIYFSSHRKDSYGDKDIYSATLDSDPVKLVMMKGRIIDSLSHQPVEAKITVRDKNTHELIGVYNSNSKSGKYMVLFTEGTKYDISIEAPHYKLCIDSIDSEGLLKYMEVHKDIVLCPDQVEKIIDEEVEESPPTSEE